VITRVGVGGVGRDDIAVSRQFATKSHTANKQTDFALRRHLEYVPLTAS
jgi:hypothetical protein